MTLPRLIPNPILGEDDARRWRHQDLCDAGRLSLRAIWAERKLIEHELARRLLRRRSRIVHVEIDGSLITDCAWLEARARHLRAFERRHRGA
jgi:hypothetical protein